MLAQRYPTAYDGIAAGAPAIYWTDFFPYMHWPQQFMNMLGTYPYGCELDAITAAAVADCDALDGILDGVIVEVDACLARFDPFSVVGTAINCTEAGGETLISSAAAAVANATWNGLITADGKRTWYGISPGADLTGNDPATLRPPGIAATSCAAGTCVGAPNAFGVQWLQLFVAQDPAFDLSNLTHAEFDRLAHLSRQMYRSIIGTDDPDLSAFRDAGGKLVTFHGLVGRHSFRTFIPPVIVSSSNQSEIPPRYSVPQADHLIPPKGTEHYYKAVAALLPDIGDFYRHYEVPGLGHCFGGRGGQPTGLFAQLRAWVENGTAPGPSPGRVTDLEGEVRPRVLCPYPQKARLDKECESDSSAAAVGPESPGCWSCVDPSET